MGVSRQDCLTAAMQARQAAEVADLTVREHFLKIAQLFESFGGEQEGNVTSGDEIEVA
jgi:hypothetical protein